MKKTQLPAAALLAVVLLAAPAAAEVFIEARSWPADLGGRLQLENLEANEFLAGIDPINDLGLKEDGAFEARLLFRPGRRIAVRLAWLPLAFSGSAEITGEIGSIRITPRVDSNLDLDYGRVAVAWQFLSSSDGRFRLGPMIEAKGFQGEASISVDNPIVPLVATTTFETAVPSVGLMLDLEPTEQVHVFAEATTLIDTGQGDLRDFEAGVRYFVTEALGLTAGIRLIEIDVTDRGNVLEIDIEGTFFGVFLRF